jgi:hypothetical protein
MSTNKEYSYYLTSLVSYFPYRDAVSITSSEISNLPVDDLIKLSYLNTLLFYYKGSLKDYSLIMYSRDDLYRKYENKLLSWKMRQPVSKMNIVNKKKKVFT